MATSRKKKVDQETLTAVGVIVLAVVALGVPARAWEATVGWAQDLVVPELSDEVAWWGGWVVVALAGGASVVYAARAAAHRRADVRDRLRVAVARASNTDPDHLDLSRLRWSKGRPVRGRVRYSSAFDDAPGSKSRASVEEVIARKVDAPLVFVWEPHRDTVRWSPGEAPQAGEVVEPEPVKVGAQQRRLVTSLSATMRGDIAMTVDKADAVGPLAFTIRYPDNVRDDSDELRVNVQKIVNAKLPGRYKLAWDTEKNTVTGERRPPMPFPVPHPSPQDTDQWSIPFGVDEHGDPAVWDLRVAPHLLVVGSTGSGKTALLSGLLCEASHRGFDIHIIDGKGTALAGFRDWPSVKGHGLGEPEDMSDAMLAVEELMRDRYRRVRDDGLEPGDFDPVLVILDEAAEFSTNVALWWKEAKERGGPRDAPALSSWRAIARLGRECRVHLVLGIQQAAADFLGGTEARDNFGLRVGCGPVTEHGARMAFGRSDVGRDVPAEPKGRATVAYMSGEPTEVQVFWTPAPKPNGAVRPGDAPLLEPFGGAR